MKARWTLEARFALASGLAVAAGVSIFAALASFGAPLLLSSLLALGGGFLAAIFTARVFWRPFSAALAGIADGVRGFKESDFGFRLAGTGHLEIDELVGLYNEMGDVLRGERNEIYQRELLLDTLLQGAPMAILLFNPLDRVSYANTAARRLFARVGRLEGLLRADLGCQDAAVRAALLAGADTTVAARNAAGEEETYRLVFRTFQLNAHPHTLAVVEVLTRDVRRQELSAWRKVIRVVSHEVNNSLAPVSSLVHSARLAARSPGRAALLGDILATIEERVRHLSRFLEGYATLARLPNPRPERVAWAPFLESVSRAVSFRVTAPPEPSESLFDPAQVQQVLLNLLKNAAEAGSPEHEISVCVEPGPLGGSLLRVMDRGSGMDEDTLRLSTLPLSAGDRGGRGLGLPLCAEILAAHGGDLLVSPRAGGGTVVTCRFPPWKD